MKLTKCLCCEGELVPLIDFGPMPLVNTYHVQQRFPLAVNRCLSCFHLQLDETVDPKILYQDYAYCSGTGTTAQRYFRSFAEMALTYCPTAKTVLDVASNDGSQLDAFQKLGLRTYGIDPAENLADLSRLDGHHIEVDFFEEHKFELGFTPDIITAQNVLGHTSDPLKFLKKAEDMMHDDSRLFIATSQANMIVNGECDTIYHEHVSYFNAHSMKKLAKQAGLHLLDIVMHDIHGTSFIFVLGKDGEPTARVFDRLEWELTVGMLADPLYNWWKNHCQRKINEVAGTIYHYQDQGFFTVGCGAAAKGISMLNMANVRLDLLMDTTPTKIGKQASGMNIVSFDELKKFQAHKILFVILAWNVLPEIKRNILSLRDNPDDVFIRIR